MGTVSIEIAGFENLVSAVDAVRTELPADRGQVSSALAGVVLSTDSLTPVESVLGWADDEIRGLQRRLAFAKVIEASTPGQQLYVQFDESQISTKSDAEIAADVETIQEWVEDGGGEIPDDVLQILQEGAADPYFARALAGAVPVEDLSFAVLNAGHHRETIMQDAAYSYEDPLATIEAYDARYDLFLDSLGTSMGVASQGTGDLAPPEGFTEQWIEGIAGDSRMPGQASTLAMVVSRGTWATDFSVDLVQAIHHAEQSENGGYKGMWEAEAYPGMSSYLGAVQPGGEQTFDPLALALQAVGRDPEAGLRLFEESGQTTVTVDGEEHQVSTFMDYLISQRQWPVDEGAAAGDAILAAATPYEGGSTYSMVVASDARLASLAFQQDVETRGDDAPWWSSAGHIVLDVLGLVPVVGEVADGINAVWYFAEGNVIDGTLSVAALVPIGGQGATAGKWGRRVLRGEEAATVLRNLDHVPLDETLGSVQVLARADNVSPGVFEFRSLDELNAAANTPHPGVTYRYRDQSWTTDEFGRTSGLEGQLRLEPGARDPTLQRDIGNGPDALDSDVGFHLIADSLGGPTNRLNVLPGNGRPIDDGLANLNQGAYSSMERTLRGALDSGSSVKLEMEVIYPPGSTVRPSEFQVGAWIDGNWVEFGPFINK